jgi:molybdate transport system substrate-binding protein
MRRRRVLLAPLAAALATRAAAAADAAPARVAAASDLQFVLPEVAAGFERATGQRVELTFGSSGNFARQIQQGAPFDLFLSADEGYALRLAEAGLTRDRGRLYAVGHIALIVPAASTMALDDRLQGVKERLADLRRFAIANPELAPYGRAAREALQALALWEALQPKLVLGENISQATQYVATASAQAGITSASLARAPAVAERTRHIVLPETLHAPLRQRMVLLRDARPAAIAFHDHVTGRDAQAVFAAHGFGAPPLDR